MEITLKNMYFLHVVIGLKLAEPLKPRLFWYLNHSLITLCLCLIICLQSFSKPALLCSQHCTIQKQYFSFTANKRFLQIVRFAKVMRFKIWWKWCRLIWMAGVPLQIAALVKSNAQMEYFFKMRDISLWKCHDFLWPVVFLFLFMCEHESVIPNSFLSHGWLATSSTQQS